MPTEITIWIITIISLLLGYALGKNKLSKEGFEEATRLVKRQFNASRVGVVLRPSAQDLWDRDHPQVKEGKQAFKEALDQIPEVAEAVKEAKEHGNG